MKFTEIKCNNCGSTGIDVSKKVAKCEHCGTQYSVQKIANAELPKTEKYKVKATMSNLAVNNSIVKGNMNNIEGNYNIVKGNMNNVTGEGNIVIGDMNESY